MIITLPFRSQQLIRERRHTPVHIIVLHNDPIDPLQELLVAISEVLNNHANNVIGLGIPDDGRFLFIDGVLEVAQIKLMGRFPGPAIPVVG